MPEGGVPDVPFGGGSRPLTPPSETLQLLSVELVGMLCRARFEVSDNAHLLRSPSGARRDTSRDAT